ncbi:hypothetical protein [Microbacterium sp. Root180]|uniref:hypothetical protein n=1 Tax=Microbacterium sp. Root180 TaxID=1736483 RepID=UPI0006FBCF9F|nr:hypothetical protein [Microbacterium sp. Root180]KRB36274.1 hypothetical protein ASD93_09265 [Microbacterium sp. Root180]
MTAVVILAPGGEISDAALSSLKAEGADVAVITVAPPPALGVRSVGVPPPSPAVRRIDGWMRRTAVGRAVRRLTPVDPGSRFWRATRRSREAAELLSSAQIVVAVERDAFYAAWRSARRGGAGVQVVSGVSAATARLRAIGQTDRDAAM